MISNCKLFLFFILFSCSCIYLVNCDCQVTATPYSSVNGLVITNVAHIITFVPKCTNRKDLFLYADVNGKTIPAVRSLDGQTYQISWTADLAKSSSASYSIPVYDEEGFSQLRKAQRAGESVNVKPLFELSLNHSGTYKGPLIQTEIVATLAAILLWYFAYSAKNKLTS